jgi:outer membrane lipoprotein-sorting protein
MPFKKLNFLLIVLSLLMHFASWAQAPKGFTAINQTGGLQSSLGKAAHTIKDISADFSQVKEMKMLQDKVSSKGRFYFKKDDKIRIEYTQPFEYLLVMNAGRITVKDENKTSKINTRNSKTMQSVNRIMMDCMSGNVMNNKDFSVAAFENSSQILLQLTPANAAMKNMFARIDVYIDKSDYTVAKLTMNEAGGDFTQMTFSNKKLNKGITDALFNIR